MSLSRFLKSSCTVWVCVCLLSIFNPVLAAKRQNLRHQPLASLAEWGLLPSALPRGAAQTKLQEQSRSVDFKQRLHIRLQETYSGYPVWGAQVVLHLPGLQQGGLKQAWPSLLRAGQKGKMNGYFYQELETDLQGAPAFIFSEARAKQALAHALILYRQKRAHESGMLQEPKAHLFIYIDQNQKARWVYFIQFKQKGRQGLPQKPSYLMDAVTFEVYRTWDEIQTREPLSENLAGGYGGNLKVGMLVYDGQPRNYAALMIRRDDRNRRCYLENNDVVVKDARHQDLHHLDQVESFSCSVKDARHQNLFWNGSLDAVNGAYSPANDALYIGTIIKEMYEQWYGLPPLVKGDGKPMPLIMRVHEDMENAYWDGETMTFGDGGSFFYPLVSLGVGAHEISHGFTEQHAGLIYDGQSGGLNESFSDMAAQAAEYFAYGKNQWQIGPEILKDKKRALRYMDHPSLDCLDRGPQEACSIENVNEYHDELNVHLSSGIFNRVFYLIGTAPGWTTKTAFDVMVQANRYYWTPITSFAEAACGVMDAVQDYGYPEQAVIFAFKKVGLDVSQC